jgi:hypothetical protein
MPDWTRLLHLRMKRRPPLRTPPSELLKVTLALTDDMGVDALDLAPFDRVSLSYA